MSDWENSAHAHLPRTHLQAFVLLMIHEFITGARLLGIPRSDWSQYIAENGDAITHRIPGRTAQAIGAVVEAIATYGLLSRRRTFHGHAFRSAAGAGAHGYRARHGNGNSCGR